MEIKGNCKPQKGLALETNKAYKKQFERQFKQQQEQLVLKLSQNEMINDQLQTQLKINTTLLEAFNKLLVTGMQAYLTLLFH
jgi:ribosomal protein L9